MGTRGPKKHRARPAQPGPAARAGLSRGWPGLSVGAAAATARAWGESLGLYLQVRTQPWFLHSFRQLFSIYYAWLTIPSLMGALAFSLVGLHLGVLWGLVGLMALRVPAHQWPCGVFLVIAQGAVSFALAEPVLGLALLGSLAWNLGKPDPFGSGLRKPRGPDRRRGERRLVLVQPSR